MKITEIKIDKSYNKDRELNDLIVSINFNTANPSDKPDGDALYYLICALQKCNGKSHKNLDFMEKMEVLNRLNSSIAKLQEIRKELN